MTTELQKIEIVYLGKRMVKGDKVAHAFILPARLEKIISDGEGSRFPQDITEDIDRHASLFTVKGTGPASIGGIYEADGIIVNDSISQLVPTRLQWKRPVNGISAHYLPAWKTMSEGVELYKRRKSAEKNAFADRRFMEAIDVLKDRYRKIPAGYKRGFMLWLQDELGKR